MIYSIHRFCIKFINAGTITGSDVLLFGICTANASLVCPDNTDAILRQKKIIYL